MKDSKRLEENLRKALANEVNPEPQQTSQAFAMHATVTIKWGTANPIMKKERYYVLSDKGKDGMNLETHKKKPTKLRLNKPIKPKPRLVICLLEDHSGNIARGVAVCSLSEKWNIEEGKSTSYLYAVEALVNEDDMNRVRRERSRYVIQQAVKNPENFPKFRMNSVVNVVDNKCPHGLVFGYDFEEDDYCDDCLDSEVMIYDSCKRESKKGFVKRKLKRKERDQRMKQVEEDENEDKLIVFDCHSYYNPELTMFEMGVMEVVEVIV